MKFLVIENYEEGTNEPDLVQDWFHVFNSENGHKCYTMHMRAFPPLRIYSQQDMSISIFRETWVPDWELYLMLSLLVPIFALIYF